MTFVLTIALIVLFGSFLGSVTTFFEDMRWRRAERLKERHRALFRVCILDTEPRGAVAPAPRRVLHAADAPEGGAIRPARVAPRPRYGAAS